jgi:Ni,Fe-hydrogenase maturation factor
MKVYVFGNQDFEYDNKALTAAKEINDKIPGVEFITINPNGDLPIKDGEDVLIMDTVDGISETTLISDTDLDKIILTKSATAHDFDLSFQIKYLKKLGKLGKVYIIGIPMKGAINYDLIHSTLRKLVAQDIQGS